MIRRIAQACLMVAMAVATAPAVGAQTGTAAVPHTLQAPDGNDMKVTTFATGVQIYTCTARTDAADQFAWTFKAPEADLWNDAGERVGIHYGGPSWQANDGSMVVGVVVARAGAAAPDAIPWLLLKATSTDGAGIFSGVTYIQWLETAGGVAPPDGCDRPAAGVERAVPYVATYAFYVGAAR